jgi:hypothetical protein
VDDHKIPLGGTCTALAGRDERDGRAGGGGVRAARLHGKGSAARLNTMLVTRTVLKAKLTLSQPRLVAVPMARAADGAWSSGVGRTRRALLSAGGPELEAQRATVHRAARAMESPNAWPKMSY